MIEVKDFPRLTECDEHKETGDNNEADRLGNLILRKG